MRWEYLTVRPATNGRPAPRCSTNPCRGCTHACVHFTA